MLERSTSSSWEQRMRTSLIKRKEKVYWNCYEPGHFKNKCPVAEDADESNLTETLMEDECWIVEEDR